MTRRHSNSAALQNEMVTRRSGHRQPNEEPEPQPVPPQPPPLRRGPRARPAATRAPPSEQQTIVPPTPPPAPRAVVPPSVNTPLPPIDESSDSDDSVGPRRAIRRPAHCPTSEDEDTTSLPPSRTTTPPPSRTASPSSLPDVPNETDTHEDDPNQQEATGLEGAKERRHHRAMDLDILFERGDGKNNKETRCKFCPKTFSTTTSTGTIRGHTEKHHYNEAIALLTEKKIEPQFEQYRKEMQRNKSSKGKRGRPEYIPRFSLEAMVEFLARFMVVNDQSLYLVECREFRDFILLLREDMEDGDIPHRTKMRKVVIEMWLKYYKMLQMELVAALGKINFTADMWTTFTQKPIWAITGHWIARIDGHLRMRSALLAFRRVRGAHTGKRLAKISFNCLEDLGVVKSGKVGKFTLDNGSNNGTMLPEFETLLRLGDYPHRWDADDSRIRCFGHVIHICVTHTVDAFCDMYENDTFEDDNDFPMNPLTKCRKTVQAVRATDDRKSDFTNIIEEGNKCGHFMDEHGKPAKLPELELIHDVKTRWDSLFKMLNRSRILKSPIHTFLNLSAYHSYRHLLLTDNEALALQDLEVVLMAPHRVQNAMTGQRTPTLSAAIPAFEMFLTSWEQLIEKQPRLAPYTKVGLDWANKYYDRFDETRAYIVAMFINPMVRFTWIKKHWHADHYEHAKEIIRGLMQEYQDSEDRTSNPEQQSDPVDMSSRSHYALDALASVYELPEMDIYNRYDSSSSSSSHAHITLEHELNTWLSAPLCPPGTDLLAYWQNEENGSFSTIFSIAMDYLSIQAMSVPSEQVFSSAAETDTKKRNRMSPVLLEALQMLKFGFKEERLDFMSCRITSEVDMREPVEQRDFLRDLARDGMSERAIEIVSKYCDEFEHLVDL